ncbi:MAG: copper-translocating P-type ATPase [Oligoflexales bacterium]|nr:copper-translocating P-type ATPase [Oligoflexales bacterium]
MPAKITMEIEGMNCNSCAARIEHGLKKVAGINDIQVNLLTKKAVATFDPSVIDSPDIIREIGRIGYMASIVSDETKRPVIKKNEMIYYRNRLIAAAAFGIPLFLIAMGHMIGIPMPDILSGHANPRFFAALQIILVIPVIIAGFSFYSSGFSALLNLAPNMDSLIAIGTASAFIYSVWNTLGIYAGESHLVDQLYYETSATIIILILFGRFLENLSKGRASAAIGKLSELRPNEAILIKEEGRTEVIDLSKVRPGDVLLVRAGDRIPTDGEVARGESYVDESMITGEPVPVKKFPGARLTGATINQNGTLEMVATRVGSDTVLSQIIKMVEQAQGKKAPIARLADVISLYFVPLVIAVAVVSAALWLLAGSGFVFSMKVFVAVLVIACPCALGLSTPTAIMVATGKGASLGILYKGGDILEQTCRIDTVVFDKTGTLTEGRPSLAEVVMLGGSDERTVLGLAASVEQGASHPIAAAIVKGVRDRGIEIDPAPQIETHPGMGVVASAGAHAVAIGNLSLLRHLKVRDSDLPEALPLARRGMSITYVVMDGEIAALLGIRDMIRDDAAQTVCALTEMGIRTVLLSGDGRDAASEVAARVGIKEAVAEVLPQDKAACIEKLRKEGKIVAMVGDGINDAPALAAADIGISVGSGTDVAIETSDIVLMQGSLFQIVTAIRLSRAALKNIKQNLFWALFYNSAGIPVAAGLLKLFGGPMLNPMIAALAMAMSSVSVVGNALRLRRFTAC